MNVLRPKAGVSFSVIAPAGGVILAALGMAAMSLKRDLTITCWAEGHAATDPHTLGEAADLSVRDMPEATILALVMGLRSTLGPKFTVLYEVPVKPHGVLASLAYVNPAASAAHLHIQRAKGTTYVPSE